MIIHQYEKLLVWQKSMDVVENIYKLTKKFPSTEIYGLTSQIRRASISIPSNIAEGSRRKTKKDFNHFLVMAFGSGAELETQLQIAKRLQFATIEECLPVEELLSEVMKMLHVLIAKNS